MGENLQPHSELPFLVVVLNYRTADLTIDCLRSLAGETAALPGLRVTVLDNASGDDSVARIGAEIDRNGWQSWARLEVSERNLGFAGGNNLAMRSLRGRDSEVRYVLLLNSDTVVRPGALGRCLATMEQDPSIGVMSCLLLDRDGSLQNTTRSFPTPLRQVICSLGLPWLWPGLFGWANVYDVPEQMIRTKRDCDWLAGAFMLVRREALEKVGGMDEDFFFYGEDIDFCWRFWKAGYRVHYDPAVAIVHIGGASSDPSRVPARQLNTFMWQSRYLVQRKCFGRAAAWLIRAVDVLAFALRKMRMVCAGRQGTEKYRVANEVLKILCGPLNHRAGRRAVAVVQGGAA